MKLRDMFLLAAALLCVSAPALAAYKCESGGRVSYTDVPCDGGKVIELNAVSPDNSHTAERQTALERNKLSKLERERHRHEAAEERELRKASHESAARRKKCTTLQRRQKRSNEDVARTAGRANEKAKLKAQRVAEEYETQCGNSYERELGFAR
ncbi:DUF4124 domain-containing protein [Herbaspirillum sp. HC18]|nr:DUF4124 domain-containing protein [Herbaspirillum sp. HC18]